MFDIIDSPAAAMDSLADTLGFQVVCMSKTIGTAIVDFLRPRSIRNGRFAVIREGDRRDIFGVRRMRARGMSEDEAIRMRRRLALEALFEARATLRAAQTSAFEAWADDGTDAEILAAEYDAIAILDDIEERRHRWGRVDNPDDSAIGLARALAIVLERRGDGAEEGHRLLSRYTAKSSAVA